MAAKQAKPACIDHVTVLMTAPGHTASKRFVKTAAGIQKTDFNAGFLFKLLEPLPVTDIVSLHEALTAIESFPNMLVIRGAPLNASHAECWIRRLGDGSEGSNFATPSIGRRWVLIDFDKIALPKKHSLKKDTVAVCDYLIGLLPPEFHDVSYHWQLSSSAGVFNTSTVSMHIWFWLDWPVPDADLKTWAKAVNDKAGYTLVDPALFQSVQAHYTAAPIFEGMANPFPVRSGLVTKARGAVNLVLPASPVSRRPASGKSGIGSQVVCARGGSGFEFNLASIGDHPGGGGFHAPIVKAAASYVSEHGADGTDVEHLYRLIRGAVLNADAHLHDPATVADRASREHIMPAIESALRKFGDQPASRRKASVVYGVPPHFKSNPMTVEEALQAMTAFANRAR